MRISLRSMMLLPWIVCVSACLLAANASAQSAPLKAHPARSITYSYELRINRKPDLCQQMHAVFNERFSNLWDIKDAVRIEDVAEGSKFVYSRLPDVEFSGLLAIEVLFSKLPTSPEFDAIVWQEGRVVTGAPPGVPISASARSRPALVAYADIDNNGAVDTLLRYGFNPGYRNMLRGMLGGEYLKVWRSKRVEIPANSSLWVLQNSQPVDDRPASLAGSYLRPLVFKGRTYLADYEMTLADGGENSGRQVPESESMSIVELLDQGQKNIDTGNPTLSRTILCEYRMIQVR